MFSSVKRPIIFTMLTLSSTLVLFFFLQLEGLMHVCVRFSEKNVEVKKLGKGNVNFFFFFGLGFCGNGENY